MALRRHCHGIVADHGGVSYGRITVPCRVLSVCRGDAKARGKAFTLTADREGRVLVFRLVCRRASRVSTVFTLDK